MAQFGFPFVFFGLFVGHASAILISAITKCEVGATDPAGDLKVYTIQVCNLFGNTCVINHPETTSENCATEALTLEHQTCALYPIKTYKNKDRSVSADLMVGQPSCSVSGSSGDYKFSGACVYVQCKTAATTWVGPGMSGSGSTRSAVTDSATASNFVVHQFASIPSGAKNSKTVFLSRTGNFVGMASRGGYQTGTYAYAYGKLPTSGGNNYGPNACPGATTLVSAATLTAGQIRTCGSTGKWTYYNTMNLLMDKSMYSQVSANLLTGATGVSTSKKNINPNPFLSGESTYSSGEAMNDPRDFYLYDAATSSGSILMTSATMTPATSPDMATQTITGTYRSYTVVFYCTDYARVDLTACPTASQAMFYVADPNPAAQFGTSVSAIGGGGGGAGATSTTSASSRVCVQFFGFFFALTVALA